MEKGNSREIWIDIIGALNRLREQRDRRRFDSNTDPRAQLVGEPYNYPSERIQITEIDLESLEFQYDGPVPNRINRQRRSDGGIGERWSDYIFDRCAWYRSFHYNPQSNWGIHINEDCWIKTATEF